MTDILIAVMVIAIVVLGTLTVIKFQRATGGTSEQEKKSKKKASHLPRELQDLQIEGPQENTLDHPEEPKGNPRGQQRTPDRSAS